MSTSVLLASSVLQILRCLFIERDTPWCFYPDGGGEGGDCDTFNWAAEGPGFTDEFYNIMKAGSDKI